MEDKTREKLIRLINNRLGISKPIRVNGRDCDIRVVADKDSREFTDKHHLQGYSASSIRLGIYYNDKLLGLMTFGKPRFNSRYEYELIRLVWDTNYAVIGGAEKLYKHFIRNYNPTSVISYCDISKFNGKVYGKLGFKLGGLSAPNYKWVSMNGDNTVLTRYQTQKKRLIAYGYGDESQTEVEIMQSLGFLRVYDCGNAKFTWQGRGDNKL